MEYKLYFSQRAVQELASYSKNAVRSSLMRLKFLLANGVINKGLAQKADQRVGHGVVLSPWIAISYCFDECDNCVILAIVGRRRSAF